jgi:hypothetical protein
MGMKTRLWAWMYLLTASPSSVQALIALGSFGGFDIIIMLHTNKYENICLSTRIGARLFQLSAIRLPEQIWVNMHLVSKSESY